MKLDQSGDMNVSDMPRDDMPADDMSKDMLNDMDTTEDMISSEDMTEDMVDPPDMPAMTCDTGNASTVGTIAESGACVATMCAEGFTDKNSNLTDGCECIPERSPIDGNDDNCDGYDFDVNSAIFLSETGDDAADGRTPASSVSTFARALTLIDATRPNLIVQQGKYTESVAINKTVNIYGGHSSNWERQVDAKSTISGPIIQSIQDAPATLRLIYTNNTVKIDNLHIVGPNLQQGRAKPGASSVAIRVVDHPKDTLFFTHMLIEGGKGRNGKDGIDGAKGSDGQDGTRGTNMLAGRGGASMCMSTGGNGGATQACSIDPYGQAGDPGLYEGNNMVSNIRGGAGGGGGENDCMATTLSCDAGKSAGSNGRPGTNGMLGAIGRSLADAQTGSFAPTGKWISPQPAILSKKGEPGTGGGGGGGGGKAFGRMDEAGFGGGGGGAGCGGQPGETGQAGGASVALLLINSTASLDTFSTIQLGFSGSGGKGGKGGEGGVGGKGKPGGDGSGMCANSLLNKPGGDGGDGGKGGDGAPGIGGCAGSIFGVVTIENSALENDPAFIGNDDSKLGTGGAGGDNNADLKGCKGKVVLNYPL